MCVSEKDKQDDREIQYENFKDRRERDWERERGEKRKKNEKESEGEKRKREREKMGKLECVYHLSEAT